MHKNWLITGGCGFIGINLIKLLIQNESVKKIVVVDNLSVGKLAHLNAVAQFTEVDKAGDIQQEGFFFIKQDIMDGDFAKEVTNDIDTIVHLAANTGVQPSLKSPVMDMQTNVIGTVNYLEGAVKNGVKNFVLASSGAPTGDVQPPIHEKLPCRPMSPYGASKLAGEGYCSAYYHSYGLNTIALRFSNVYGELSFHKGSVVALFIKQALQDKPWTVNGDGTQTRDFIYVGDLIKAVIAAGTANIGGEIVQVGTGVETSVLDLKDKLGGAIKDNLNKEIEVQFVEPLNGDMPRNYADISKAKSALNWQPEVALDDGLKKTVSWFAENAHKFSGD